jgi:hypothetical protein
MKSSEIFKNILENYLSQTAQSDTAFAVSYAKLSKNIEDCLKYIGCEVKKTGFCAFADQEIFDMALRYYNDDSIFQTPKINFKAVVNQPVKADLFNTAPLETPKDIATETVVAKTPKPAPTTLTLFDL